MRSTNLIWRTELRKALAARAAGPRVREERLGIASSLGGSGYPLTGWRGDSGRRYVVGIHLTDREEFDADFADLCAVETDPVVLIAVRRPDIGEATIVDACSAAPGAVQSWIHAAFAWGACELHVHRLADGEAARRAILADLMPSEAEPEPEPDALDVPEPADAA